MMLEDTDKTKMNARTLAQRYHVGHTTMGRWLAEWMAQGRIKPLNPVIKKLKRQTLFFDPVEVDRLMREDEEAASA